MPWNEIEEGQATAEKIPAGTHTLRVVKVLRGKKDGTIFTSKSGDPQIMVVYADQEARECAEMLTLSRKAAWKLKNLLIAVGADLDKMDKAGKDWTDFEDEDFASVQLCDRPFRGEVTYKKGTGDHADKEFASVNPLREPAEAMPAADDVPF